MEIISWALMEELEFVLKPRGWQTPLPHTPNKPNAPYHPSQIHITNLEDCECLKGSE